VSLAARAGYLMHSNEPYQRYIDQGLFRMVPRVRRDQRTGENINYSKTLITGKGLTHPPHPGTGRMHRPAGRG
jgi:hypothetical protein